MHQPAGRAAAGSLRCTILLLVWLELNCKHVFPNPHEALMKRLG
jgi:hypothetical protein